MFGSISQVLLQQAFLSYQTPLQHAGVNLIPIMYTTLPFILLFLRSASCQVTGTYAVQVTATTETGSAGTMLANYPQCAVSIEAPLLPFLLLDQKQTHTIQP